MKDFILFASEYLLEDLVEEDVMQMVVYYKRFVFSFFQLAPNEQNIKEGLRCLMEFAKIAERVLIYLFFY